MVPHFGLSDIAVFSLLLKRETNMVFHCLCWLNEFSGVWSAQYLILWSFRFEHRTISLSVETCLPFPFKFLIKHVTTWLMLGLFIICSLKILSFCKKIVKILQTPPPSPLLPCFVISLLRILVLLISPHWKKKKILI